MDNTYRVVGAASPTAQEALDLSLAINLTL